jgi:hypothetical protein
VVRQSAQVKASRRLDIRSKVTVAAPRTKREGGGGGEEET